MSRRYDEDEDFDDRPRRQRRRQAGPSPVAMIGAVLGVTLVLAGAAAVGLLFLLGPTKPPANALPGAKMPAVAPAEKLTADQFYAELVGTWVRVIRVPGNDRIPGSETTTRIVFGADRSLSYEGSVVNPLLAGGRMDVPRVRFRVTGSTMGDDGSLLVTTDAGASNLDLGRFRLRFDGTGQLYFSEPGDADGFAADPYTRER